MLRIGHDTLKFPNRMCKINAFSCANFQDLSIYVSDSLSLSYHIGLISCKAHYRRRQLLETFAYTYIEFQKFIFCTYVRPSIEHNSAMWSPNLVQI